MTPEILAKARRLCPPPSNFTPAGNIRRATVAFEDPPFIAEAKRKERLQGARAAGARFERRGHQYLLRTLPLSYVPAPWFRFLRAGQSFEAWCQPDGLILDIRRRRLTVVEFKLKHTPTAWWQVRLLYEPVVRAVFGHNWSYAALAVVRWYDPHVGFPEELDKTKYPDEVSPGAFGMHIYNGRG